MVCSVPRILSVLAVVLAVPGLLAAQVVESRVRADGLRTISVIGLAEQTVTPDLAVLTVGVESRGRTAMESVAANGKEMNALMDVLKENEIALEDIQTSGFSLRPLYESRKSEASPVDAPVKVVGYAIENEVTITIRDTKKVGRLLDLMVKAGVNEIENLSFSLSNRKALLRELRKQALTDSLEKAEDAATVFGMARGQPVSVQIQDLETVAQYSFAARSVKHSDNNSPRSMPVALGQEVVRVAVEVSYELKAPQ
ncbi:SIMPL domain-containing protein [Singulisphaera sp. Ch08]|uniref:SIMPL domain-containing protein n=1 Tax=Singulisphaera sp. Ch08 TaxID=3120278 RepID=A0AAU7CJC0_9BACT